MRVAGQARRGSDDTVFPDALSSQAQPLRPGADRLKSNTREEALSGVTCVLALALALPRELVCQQHNPRSKEDWWQQQRSHET
jgi:hypothetical protein